MLRSRPHPSGATPAAPAPLAPHTAVAFNPLTDRRTWQLIVLFAVLHACTRWALRALGCHYDMADQHASILSSVIEMTGTVSTSVYILFKSGRSWLGYYAPNTTAGAWMLRFILAYYTVDMAYGILTGYDFMMLLHHVDFLAWAGSLAVVGSGEMAWVPYVLIFDATIPLQHASTVLILLSNITGTRHSPWGQFYMHARQHFVHPLMMAVFLVCRCILFPVYFGAYCFSIGSDMLRKQPTRDPVPRSVRALWFVCGAGMALGYYEFFYHFFEQVSVPDPSVMLNMPAVLQTEPPAGVMAAPLENNIMLWNAVIFGPADTPFEDGTFKLTLEFTEEYPNKAPKVRFVSKTFHPNVYADGSICLDVLQNRWSPTFNVAGILASIQSLLDEPNPNSPANSLAAQLYQENKKEYEKHVHECVEASWMDDAPSASS